MIVLSAVPGALYRPSRKHLCETGAVRARLNEGAAFREALPLESPFCVPRSYHPIPESVKQPAHLHMGWMRAVLGIELQLRSHGIFDQRSKRELQR
jgi:hypothetical protein